MAEAATPSVGRVPSLMALATRACTHPIIQDSVRWGFSPQFIAHHMMDCVVDYELSHIPRAYGWLQPAPVPEWHTWARQNGCTHLIQGAASLLPPIPNATQYNPYGQDIEHRLNGACFLAYDRRRGLCIRVDHSTCPEFWLEIIFPVNMLRDPNTTGGFPLRPLRGTKGRFPFRSPQLRNTSIKTNADVRLDGETGIWEYTIYLPEIPLGKIVFSRPELVEWAQSNGIDL